MFVDQAALTVFGGNPILNLMNNNRQNTPPQYPLPNTKKPMRAIERETPSFAAHSTTHQRKDWVWVLLASLMIMLVILGSFIFVAFLRASPVENSPLSQSIVQGALPTPVDARQDYSNTARVISQRLTLEDGRTIDLTPWDGDSRLTLLVMGLDRRPHESGLTYRTDTMMLVSIDPQTQSIGVMSIPRDLYVDIPGYSELQRVNTALVLGELQQENFGATLAMQTIQYNLGIRVHEYVVADFQAFITLIDALGGLDINIPSPIYDYQYPDMYYGFDPFVIQAGQQHLDGATALKYARTRHGDSDFERARRQQMVLFALRDQLFNADVFPQLLVRSPQLFSSVSRNVTTSLSLDQILQVALYMKDIPPENIHTGVIDGNYSVDYVTAEGAAVLIPQRQRLAMLMTDVFGTNYSQ